MNGKCLCCGKNSHVERHHVIPEVLNPESNMIISLCPKCHDKLNSLYVHHPAITTLQLPQSFKEFRLNFEKLREDFYSKKLNRSEFGEALWTNLVNYLEKTSNEWSHNKKS